MLSAHRAVHDALFLDHLSSPYNGDNSRGAAYKTNKNEFCWFCWFHFGPVIQSVERLCQIAGLISNRFDGRPRRVRCSEQSRIQPRSERMSVAILTASGEFNPVQPFMYTSRQLNQPSCPTFLALIL